MRWPRLAAAVLLLALASVPAAAEEYEHPLRMEFGLGRRPLTRTLTVPMTASPGAKPATIVEDPSVRLVSDLDSGGGRGQFPSSQITLSAAAIGGTLVQLTAVAEPMEPEEVPYGSYQGVLALSAAGFEDVAVTLQIDLDDRGNPARTWKVWAALVVGGMFGTVAKWLNDTGLALHPLRRRFRDVNAQLSGLLTSLPVKYRAARTGADQAMRNGDVAGAEAHVAALEQHLDGATRLAERLRALRRRHRDNLAAARSRGVAGQDQVRQVLAAEDEAVRALAHAPLSGLPEALATADVLAGRAQLVGEVLRAVPAAGTTPRPLRDVLTKLCRGRYDEAAAAWDAIDDAVREGWAAAPPAAGAAPPSGDDEDGDTASRRRARATGLVRFAKRLWAWGQALVMDHVRLLAGVLLVAFTALVGYSQRYLEDPGFNEQASKYFGLFFYAAAVPLGGLQVVQLLGRVWPSPGGTARSTPVEGEPVEE
ncbi:MAG TPA: hypothetical protein VF519_07110 [Mycobacteriales bacterium]|jgi:hypothetical protein